MLPDANIYQLQTETAYVTCIAETPHEIIGFHLVHDNKFNVVGKSNKISLFTGKEGILLIALMIFSATDSMLLRYDHNRVR